MLSLFPSCRLTQRAAIGLLSNAMVALVAPVEEKPPLIAHRENGRLVISLVDE